MKLERKVNFLSDRDLTEQDKFDLLDWILGSMTEPEARNYANYCAWPDQIKNMSEGFKS